MKLFSSIYETKPSRNASERSVAASGRGLNLLVTGMYSGYRPSGISDGLSSRSWARTECARQSFNRLAW